jgi:hypothetical protein
LISVSVSVFFLTVVVSASTVAGALLVALLDRDGTALRLQGLGQSGAGSHSRKVLGGKDGEDVGLGLGDGGHELAGLEVVGLEAHEDEAQFVLAMRSTGEVGEAEEAAFLVVLIHAVKGRGDQSAHQSSSRSSILTEDSSLVILAIGAPKGAMDYVVRVS